MPALSARLVLLLLGVALGFSACAHAFEVEIAAPDKLKPLLEQHLEAARAARLGEEPDAAEIERLRRASVASARALLATEGYFSPQVSGLSGDGGLRFSVDPGPRTRVRTVKIGFAGALAGSADEARLRARIERLFSLKPDAPFRQADWASAKAALLVPLLSGRYLAARVAQSEARIDPEARTADLSVTVDSGPAFAYGDPEVTGALRYPAAIAINLNPVKRGQPVRQQDLLDYQAALEASTHYRQATVRIDPDPAHASAAPIRVEVVERPEKRFSLGAGFSTDTGARVQAGWQTRDIAGRGQVLSLEGKLETKAQSVSADLAWPRDADGYAHRLGSRFRREDVEGQETRSTLLSAGRDRTRDRVETALVLQYQTETQQVGGIPDTRNQALTANYAWTRRALGRDAYPRTGHVLALQAGGATDLLLSDTGFLRVYGRHTHYRALGRNSRLVLRAEAGATLADSRDGIPTDFLFRAGGDNSVRGYDYQSLGRTLDGGVASVRYLLTGSVEVDHFFGGNGPLRDWGLALFVDAGDAADAPDRLSPVFGYGVGARYRSPLGPVNLDLAYGEAIDEFRLHFSLGVSF